MELEVERGFEVLRGREKELIHEEKNTKTHSLDTSLKASNSPTPRSASILFTGGESSGRGNEEEEPLLWLVVSSWSWSFSSPAPPLLLPLPLLLLEDAEHNTPSG